MSNITNYSNSINEAFPVPGVDNDSQGFRDNFNNTKRAFDETDIAISDLQGKVLLTQELGSTNTVDNDLNNSTINNGSYTNFFGIAADGGTVSSTTPISVAEGSIHTFDLNNGNINFTFTNWPATGIYGVARVIFKGQRGVSSTPILATAGGGDIIKDLNFPANFAVTLSKTTDGTQSSGQNELVLNDTTGLVIGMVAYSTGIPSPDSTPVAPVTTITNIDSNTVTLSANLAENILNGDDIFFSYPNGRVIEAWSVNEGATVFVKHIGDF